MANERPIVLIEPAALEELIRRAVSDALAQHLLRLGVPRHKHGRRVRYKRSELEAWMATGGAKA